MFFLSKTLDVALSPLSWVLAAMIAAMFVEKKRVRVGILCAGAGLLYLFSTDLVANALFRAVERPLRTTEKKDVVYDVVVVLGGLEDELVFEETGEHGYNDNVERLLSTYDLLRTSRAKRALLSGGRAKPTPGPSEAQLLRDKLVDWGVDPARLLVEGESRNTWENAVFSKRLLDAQAERPEKVLLVTSAFHMKRAEGAFVKAGLVCDTKAVDVRTHETVWQLGAVLPRTNALLTSSAAMHEWFGRRVYALRGQN